MPRSTCLTMIFTTDKFFSHGPVVFLFLFFLCNKKGFTIYAHPSYAINHGHFFHYFIQVISVSPIPFTCYVKWKNIFPWVLLIYLCNQFSSEIPRLHWSTTLNEIIHRPSPPSPPPKKPLLQSFKSWNFITTVASSNTSKNTVIGFSASLF